MQGRINTPRPTHEVAVVLKLLSNPALLALLIGCNVVSSTGALLAWRYRPVASFTSVSCAESPNTTRAWTSSADIGPPTSARPSVPSTGGSDSRTWWWPARRRWFAPAREGMG